MLINQVICLHVSGSDQVLIEVSEQLIEDNFWIICANMCCLTHLSYLFYLGKRCWGKAPYSCSKWKKLSYRQRSQTKCINKRSIKCKSWNVIIPFMTQYFKKFKLFFNYTLFLSYKFSCSKTMWQVILYCVYWSFKNCPVSLSSTAE